MFQRKAHICVVVLLLFTELKALPSNAIYIKCDDFGSPVKSTGHWESKVL
jgi:hypothetical protein